MIPASVVPSRSPDSMAPADRVAEIGAILATGFRRHQLRQHSGQVCLAESAPPVALCDQPVNGPESAGMETE
jgi:hypothetical protein